MRLKQLLNYLPLVLAILSLIIFIVGLGSRVTSLEAEEYTTQEDIKTINTSISDIKINVGRLDEKISGIKDDTTYLRSRLK